MSELPPEVVTMLPAVLDGAQADTVINCDPWWTPAVEERILARQELKAALAESM